MLRLAETVPSQNSHIVKLSILLLCCAAASAKLLPPCKLDERFPVVRGTWVKTTEMSKSNGGYAEADCPDYVHLTDCMRQSKDALKTLAEYRYVTRWIKAFCLTATKDMHLGPNLHDKSLMKRAY